MLTLINGMCKIRRDFFTDVISPLKIHGVVFELCKSRLIVDAAKNESRKSKLYAGSQSSVHLIILSHIAIYLFLRLQVWDTFLKVCYSIFVRSKISVNKNFIISSKNT